MTLTTYKWSIAEWHELVDSGLLEGKPVEFLEGEIIEVSPQRACTHVGIEHSYTNDTVVNYLRRILDNLAYVKESHPITLDNSEPEPDVAVVRLPETIAEGDSPLPLAMSNCSSSHRTHHPYSQDIYWLIEISNRTLKTDLNQKKITYARNGIPEYWVAVRPCGFLIR